MNNNLTIAEHYYRGWENSDKGLLKISPDLKFKSPDAEYHSSEDFFKRMLAVQRHENEQ